MKNAAIAVILISSLFALAACEEVERKEDPPGVATANNEPAAAAVATDTSAHPASPGGTAAVPEVDAGTTVLIVLEDGSIGVKGETIPPGPAVLSVTNSGSTVHNLFVEGEGISRAAGDSIPAGGTVSTDVVFKPGTYTFYCPIADHRTKGEEVTVTIK